MTTSTRHAVSISHLHVVILIAPGNGHTEKGDNNERHCVRRGSFVAMDTRYDYNLYGYSTRNRRNCRNLRMAKREVGKMNKKRILTMIVFSPILLAMALVILLVACISYAITGKWELKSLLHENFPIKQEATNDDNNRKGSMDTSRMPQV